MERTAVHSLVERVHSWVLYSQNLQWHLIRSDLLRPVQDIYHVRRVKVPSTLVVECFLATAVVLMVDHSVDL